MNTLREVPDNEIPSRYVRNCIEVIHVGSDGPFTFARVVKNKHNIWNMTAVNGASLAVSRRKREILIAAKIASPYFFMVNWR